jgi:hypothetical protein
LTPTASWDHLPQTGEDEIMSTTSLWESGELPGLSGPKVAGTAIKLIRAHLPAMLVAWVAMTALAAAMSWAMANMGLLTLPATSARFIGVYVAYGLVMGVVSAAALRALVGRSPFAVDGGFMTFVALIVLVTAGATVLGKLVMGTPPTAGGDPSAAMAYLGRSLAVLVGYFVYLYLAVKLQLWIIGLAVGDRDLTPGVSWQLTRRAWWGYVLGVIFLAIIPYGAAAVLTYMARGGAPAGTVTPPPLIAAPLTGLGMLLALAAGAALFHLRRGSEGDPAGVFD